MLFSVNASSFVDGDTIRNNRNFKQGKYSYESTLLKTSPTALLWGGIFPFTSEYRIMAEIPSSRTQTEQIGISYLGKNIFLALFEKSANQSTNRVLKVSGWRIQYAHKFYLSNRKRQSPYGFYIAPLFSYANAHVAIGLNRYYQQTYFDISHSNANIIAGIQSGKKNRIKIDIYGGFGYKINSVYYHASTFRIFKYDTTDFGDFYNGHLNLLFDINLGYSF